MKQKSRTDLNELADLIIRLSLTLHRVSKKLLRADVELPSEFADIHTGIATCQESIKCLATKIDVLFESENQLIAESSDEELTDAEIDQLLAMNRYLKDITRHLRSVAADVTPRLEAKLADPHDPMFDYEIDARLDYVLREDDPEYDENEDNYLTTRTESIKLSQLKHLDDLSCAEPFFPKRLWSEPHCWLFHDLNDGYYGPESPRLSFRDCLRIGSIFIDVQVRQQYKFNVD